MKVGDPTRDDVTMGPVATAQQIRDVRDGVKGLEACAKIVFGSTTAESPIGVPAGKGFFTTPVLLHGASPQPNDAVHSHEVFGPVATVMPYDDVKGAAALVAAGGGGLVTSVYADDKDFIRAAVLALAPYPRPAHHRLVEGLGAVASAGHGAPAAAPRRPRSRRRRRGARRASRYVALHAADGAAGRPRAHRGHRVEEVEARAQSPSRTSRRRMAAEPGKRALKRSARFRASSLRPVFTSASTAMTSHSCVTIPFGKRFA